MYNTVNNRSGYGGMWYMFVSLSVVLGFPR